MHGFSRELQFRNPIQLFLKAAGNSRLIGIVIVTCLLSIANCAYAKTTPTLTLATSGTPSTYGSSVTFTATITSGTTGNISFLDGTTTIGTVAISGSTAAYTTSSLSVGSHSIKASYPGDANYNSVTSSVKTQVVNKATPTLTVATSGTPSNYGASVTFTATISAGPAGTISFFNGATSMGTINISGTTAIYSTSALTAGSHSITAKWLGNSNYNAVTSSAITQVVNKVTPTITWSSPSAITYGTALSSTQLNASSSVGGSFSYSPASGTVLQPGSRTLSVTLTPSDTTDYNTATASVSQTVLAIPPAGVITTFAGNASGDGYLTCADSGPATVASLENADGVAVDSAGNVYITDTQRSCIRKVNASTGVISTIAGTGTAGYSGDNGPAASAQISWPSGIAVDRSGNIYFADTGNAVIREISASGTITTIAGDGTGNWDYTGDGGPAKSARFAGAVDVAVDSAGNLYIADSQNMVVREVSAATGIITTVAGTGTAGTSGDGGQAISAELNYPYGVAVDAVGNLYIADMNNNRVRKVDGSTRVITTVAGNGTQGYTGDNNAAVSAELNNPIGVTVDAAGNLYISDSGNQVVRKVAVGGTITTIAGNGTAGYSGDGGPAISAELNVPWYLATDASGNVYIAEDGSNRVRLVGSNVTEPIRTLPTVTWANPAPMSFGSVLGTSQLNATANVPGTFAYTPSAGTVVQAGLRTLSVLFTPDDATHYSPVMAVVPITIQQLTPAIAWTNPAPVVYGTALSSTQLNATANVPGTFDYSADPEIGTVLEPGTHTLSVIFTPDDGIDYATAEASVSLVVQGTPGAGIITTIAGNGVNAEAGDGGPAIEAALQFPEAVALDSAGNLYIPDSSGNKIRKVSSSNGTISTIAGTGAAGFSGDGGLAVNATINGPVGIAVDAAGNVYFADTGNNRIRKITSSTGTITTIAGTGVSGYSGDGGAATSAQINSPFGIAFDSAGNLYFSDTLNSVIRKVNSSGTITTVAGNGFPGYSGDGGAPNQAELNNPGGIAVDSAGNIYIADVDNKVIRKVTVSTGKISTVAGTGVAGNTGDGGPAINAKLDCPKGVAIDSAGNLFILDYNSFVVRRVAASDGTISTVAGNGTGGFSGDGSPAISAQMSYPSGLAVDLSGNIYIADCGNNRIRLVGGSGSSQAQIAVSVSPSTVTLHSSGQQQFNATVVNSSNQAVNWTVVPSGFGTISSSGLYTAPSPVSSQQTIVITATSQADPTKSSTASVTLVPVSVSVTPQSATLMGGQVAQFTSLVTGAANQAVNWSLSPNVGTIDSSGNYTAPTTISANQIVTVTATSQADPTKSASSTVTLAAGQCASNGFNYERSIVVDGGKIPGSDQNNFPFLFSITDPLLKSVTNGGHVASASGYDIFFTSDPAGTNVLPFEQEGYDPTTGQVSYWILVSLPHTQNSTIYMWYGNPNIQASQAQSTSVWDDDYLGVWHFAKGSSLSAADSTANGYNGTDNGATSAQGKIGGAANFNGGSYIDIGSMGNLPAQGTIEFWINPSSIYNYPNAFTTAFNGHNNAIRFEENSYQDFSVATGSGNFNGYSLINGGLRANTWYHVAFTWDQTTSTATGYVNGEQVFNATDSTLWPTNIPDLAIGSGFDGSRMWAGLIDEVRVSKISRNSDWIKTEYSNQATPASFFSLSSESTIAITPGGASLAAQQQQQFNVASGFTCAGPFNWTISPAGMGNVTSSGLYTAPVSVATPQVVTVTATSQTDSTKTGSAIVNLIPPTPALTLAAATNSPYPIGTAQGFAAVLTYQSGAPAVGVPVELTVQGANSLIQGGLTDASGIVTFTYLGKNSGNDTLIAAADVRDLNIHSNSLAVSWTPSVAATTVGSVTLSTGPQIALEGLLGAFTDGNGQVIEPVAIGASPRVFVVPSGATQLELGVDDDYYADNHGPGFVVNVNDVPYTVPANAMPWLWEPGGLNSNYTFGVQDGSNPAVVAGLTPGESITVAYRSGLNSPGGSFHEIYDANGVPSIITGTQLGTTGTVSPTYYMTAAYYPVGQPASISATVKNGSGGPLANVPVLLHITGANPGLLEGTSDANGAVAFQYSGTTAGSDNLTAEAIPDGETTLVSSASTITWIAGSSLPAGRLVLSPSSVNPLPAGGQQPFTVYAADSFGAPVPNLPLGLDISGADQTLIRGTTDSTGHATILYQGVNAGTSSVKAVAFINNLVAISNVVSVPWTLPPSTGTGTGGSGTLAISISAPNTVELPNALQLSGSVSDTALPNGQVITTTWSEASGPGSVTFGNSNAISTTATFSSPGVYVLQLSATDSDASGSAQITVTVNPQPQTTQGWIGSPANGAAISGVVPVTVATGEELAGGTLTFYPVNNASAVTVLNSNTTGSAQIGTIDTTSLANGQYWITLMATDSTGQTSYNLALVTVVGNYKPGRVTSTVTDLVVPAKGLAIRVQRTYDSLNANTSGDFGYGWNLSTSVDLTVNPMGSVTFTLGGQRRTFYLTPQLNGFLPFYVPVWTAEPGMHGTLVAAGTGCTDFFDYLVPEGPSWACVGGGFFAPPGYVYTDPSGTSYTMSASGQLRSIVDKNGNALTVTPTGITSSTGLLVAFQRDSNGRITHITDPSGNVYTYGYLDGNGIDKGNLETVTYPNIPQPNRYNYDSNHFYLSGTDFRGNNLPSTSYFDSNKKDAHNNSLAGKLQSVTVSPQSGTNYVTSYDYDLTANETTITNPDNGTTTIKYDALGDVLKSTVSLSPTTLLITTNTYDSNQNLLSTTDPLLHKTCYTYDGNGNRTSVSYPVQQSEACSTIGSITSYNQYSEPIETIDELGNARYFNYDVNFNPQTVTDSLGTLASFAFNSDGTMQAGAIGYDLSAQPAKASHFTYDTNGNLAGRTDALGRTTSYTYNSLGQKATMVEPLLPGASASAATTTYTYDAFGNLKQTDAPLGRTTKSTYDANGNKSSDTDARQHTTNYTYDSLNRLTGTDYPDSTYMYKTYDFRGNVLDEWDQAGNQTRHVYDLAGRETSVTRAFGTPSASATNYTYYDDGRKQTETDALGHTTTYIYDIAGDLTSVSGVNGTFTYGYDLARNRTSMTDGNSHTTNYVYDARKRLIETDYPDANHTKKTNSYDGPGNLTSVIDQAGNEVDYTYDAANQLQSVVQTSSPSGNNITSYSYDPLGNLIGLSDANSHLTESAFDLLSQPSSKTLPDGSLKESRQYDAAGNLTTLTHFNLKTTTYTYDNLNRLLSRLPDSSTGEHAVSFTYTATGKRQKMIDASGETDYTYDSMDRLITKSSPWGTLTYAYDSAGHLASMTSSHANGVSVSYTYDSLNRLSTVVDSLLGTTTYEYDSASNVFTVAYPNGVTTTYGYDELNRVSGLGYTTQSGVYTYTRNGVGNLTNVTEPANAGQTTGRQVTWNYDGINRLTQETISSAPSGKNGNLVYGLDAVGNRTSATSTISGLTPASGTYNVDDEFNSPTESYDSNGNVTASGGKTFGYDSENQLISMGNVSLMYDGDGNRVAKTVGTTTTRYLVDDLNPTGYPQVVEELDGTGAVTRTYTYGLQRISQYQQVQSTWTPSFYQYDGGGSVRQLTNTAGVVTDQYEYDAFGNKFTVSGSTPNNYLYRGEQWDSDLGLYYLRARYYNPTTGRFMSRDPNDSPTRDSNRIPLDPKSMHKYLYGGSDPVNRIDPTGRADIIEERLLKAEVDSAAAESLLIGSRIVCGEITILGFVLEETTGQGLPQPIALPCKAVSAANVVYAALLGLGAI